jgi:uncharacterized protein (DUF1330 family)
MQRHDTYEGMQGGTVGKGYVIFVDEKINDPAGLNAYVQKALPTILQSGGKPIVFEPNPEVLEGQWPGQTVILEFESVAAAKAWYNSDAYKPLIGQRQAAAVSDGVIVGEFQPPNA